ncbi:MAG: hypothetical protein LBD22_05925 [Spirochaetaceae bacterium]|jgi:hypothetical protein|nr:hypothetical protein [Spirochaetaceae bacterium]
MRYEQVREIFNKCSGNQMRDVFIDEIETDDLDKYIERYLTGGTVLSQKSVSGTGTIIYDLEIDGLKQRIAFTLAD